MDNPSHLPVSGDRGWRADRTRTDSRRVDRQDPGGWLHAGQRDQVDGGGETTAKAVKNGKPVRLLIDGAGQIKEQN
ncbi:hypothetical protein ACVIWV_004717 [Bradyrhizobium diazoefficiens]|uniref:Uncharacterized protein n=1 Tax=Bradyrhizobium diazoefficiens TaxID=1355477 RepID=A0A0E4BTD0_9BRAD|nr:hypothetical protein NK6_7120 [Bradyrhizobium diazoefficiens]